MTPGILSLQGGFEAHGRSLERLGFKTLYVKTIDDLKGCDKLILPGGESTVMIKLLRQNNMLIPLKKRISLGMPVFGTCAGMVLLSSGVKGMNQETLGVMDFKVIRNGYGRQISSFETTLYWQGEPLKVPFIRAPKVDDLGSAVEVLINHRGSPVLVRQGNYLAASFHPELSDNDELHRYFLEM